MSGAPRSVLLAEDEPWLRSTIARFLRGKGWEVLECETAAQALRAFEEEAPDMALLDFQLSDGTALDVLPRLTVGERETPVLILTAHGSIDRAVAAIKAGADQFLTKPVDLEALALLLERSLRGSRQRRGGLLSASRLKPTAPDPFAGVSSAIRALEQSVRKVLSMPVPLLLLGETGSGKGVLANLIHNGGSRSGASFVDVNCAGFQRDLLESELFGCEKGAFTGATERRSGLFDAAHRGTLFLDEIGDLDPAVQPRLLKVLETKRFRRLGSTVERTVDVRFLFATAQDLDELVKEKRFRPDLYFRIASMPLLIPPLRDRIEDLPALADSILLSLGAELSRSQLEIEPAALELMCGYRWPGNVRELRNVLERAVLLGEGRTIRARDLRLQPAGPLGTAQDAIVPLEENERRYLARVLAHVGGDVPAAARLLGLPRSTLYFKLKRLRVGPYAGEMDQPVPTGAADLAPSRAERTS